MRRSVLTLALLGGVVLGLQAGPVSAAAWFAPYTSTAISNGQGPGPSPRGTASADFNRDGRPDLVTAASSSNVLYVPNTGGTFGTATAVTGTSNTQSLDAGDVNNDGKADFVAQNSSAVRVVLGNGNGTFTLGASYPLTLGGQAHVRLVDVTNDGKLDIVAPTFTAIQTLINNGQGGFTTGPQSAVTGSGALSAIDPARLDNDGRTDLFTVDGFSGTTFALRGDGTGRFTVSGQLYGSGWVPEDVKAIDLNGDGYDDVATVGSFSFSLATSFTDGTGKFARTTGATTQYGGPGPTSATAADFNRDGRTDLAVSAVGAPTVMVLAGNGTESMAKVGDFTVASFPQNPVVADYNGDTKLDMVTVGPGAVSLLRNTT